MVTPKQPAELELGRKALEMLVCPLTKTQLTFDAEHGELISHAARVAYPIRKGVPLLCLDESRPLSDEELQNLRK